MSMTPTQPAPLDDAGAMAAIDAAEVRCGPELAAAVVAARNHLAARLAELEAEASSARVDALKMASKYEAELATAREALDLARDYVTTALSQEREAFKGYEHCSDIPSIERDLAQLDAARGEGQ